MLSVARSVYKHKNLLSVLTLRELKARYRGSFLGYLWSLANPLFVILIYGFIFGTIFEPRDKSVYPYSLFLSVGVFPWFWVSSAWTEGANSLVANAGLIRKSKFPTELLPLVSVFSNLFHFIFSFPILICAILFFQYQGNFTAGWTIILFPLVVLIQTPFVSGFALIFSALNVHFKDTRDILNNLLTGLFFLSPILYSLDSIKNHYWFYYAVKINPLSPYFETYHAILFHGTLPKTQTWITIVLLSLLFWAIGSMIFSRLCHTFAESV